MEANTIYYFFSSFAQVWAALVGLGGMVMRDRIRQADLEMDDAFKLIVDRLYPLDQTLTRIAQANHKKEIFMSRNDMDRYLSHHGDFSTAVATFDRMKQGPPAHSFRFSYSRDGEVTKDELVRLFREATGYYTAYLSKKKLKSLLFKKIKWVVFGGLGLIVYSMCVILFTDAVHKNFVVANLLAGILVVATIFLSWNFATVFWMDERNDK